ncbi:MAG TPA: glycosyltransferase [Clostridium sp.]
MSKINKDMDFVNYLLAFTDDVGIFQHSKYGVPDRNHGYTTDDNARALILAVMLYEKFGKKKYLKLIYKYLSFVHHALNDNGMFKNFMSYQREFLESEGSEDCFGRCMWALGRTVSSPSVPENIKNTCTFILEEATKNIETITYPRAKAYTIVGLSFLKDSKEMVKHIDNLAMSLIEQYKGHKDKSWHWFEDSITYGNSFFPWSLLCAYKILGKECYLETAKESMNFLESIVMKPDFFKPIGCNGWLVKGRTPAEYDEQPIEACEMIYAYKEYYKVTKNKKCLNNALKCFNWYKGQNSKNLSLINDETGACYDGISPKGLNLNQGSESIVSYGMAVMNISK